jgi:hypothetical protein
MSWTQLFVNDVESKSSTCYFIFRANRLYFEVIKTLDLHSLQTLLTLICKSKLSVLVTAYCYGVLSYKASHALLPFYDLYFVSIRVLIIPDSSTSAV